MDESWVAARVALEMAEAIVEGRPTAPFLAWFTERGFKRWIEFIEKINA